MEYIFIINIHALCTCHKLLNIKTVRSVASMLTHADSQPSKNIR